jgi:hypothetical protein
MAGIIYLQYINAYPPYFAELFVINDKLDLKTFYQNYYEYFDITPNELCKTKSFIKNTGYLLYDIIYQEELQRIQLLKKFGYLIAQSDQSTWTLCNNIEIPTVSMFYGNYRYKIEQNYIKYRKTNKIFYCPICVKYNRNRCNLCNRLFIENNNDQLLQLQLEEYTTRFDCIKQSMDTLESMLRKFIKTIRFIKKEHYQRQRITQKYLLRYSNIELLFKITEYDLLRSPLDKILDEILFKK